MDAFKNSKGLLGKRFNMPIASEENLKLLLILLNTPLLCEHSAGFGSGDDLQTLTDQT